MNFNSSKLIRPLYCRFVSCVTSETSCWNTRFRRLRNLKGTSKKQTAGHFDFSLWSQNFNLFKVEVSIVESAKKIHPDKMTLSTAILRYETGADRFQFSFTMKSGKAFNFDRAVTETVAAFQERIRMNMIKKIRNTEITAHLVVPGEFSLEGPLHPILDEIVNSKIPCRFKVNADEEMEVLVNPPEVYGIKFSAAPFVRYPLLPNKFEASSNFLADDSKYLWECTKDFEGTKNKVKKDAKWTPCESIGMVVTPDDSMEGTILRLTCTPTDGVSWGFPTSVELAIPVGKVTASPLLYEERLSRLDPVDENDSETLRFVSYNILANVYTTEEWFCHSPKESLAYEYRLPLILKELNAYKGDVFCLQEVEEKAFEGDLVPFLKFSRNLQGVFSCKFGNTREGVAMFFNPRKLSLLEHDTIVLIDELIKFPFYNIVASHTGLKARLEDRNTVLQISVLESLAPSNPIIVIANTHLYFHPNADHIRLLQTMTSVDCVQRKLLYMKEKYPDREVKVFFCGDFNCTPPYSSYRLLTTGSVEADDFDWTSYEPEALKPGIPYAHDLKFSDSHPKHKDTNFTISFTDCLDYIFYQPHNVKLIKNYPPPDKSVIASIIGCREDRIALPNLYAPSDHVPLIADFKLSIS